MKFLIIIPAYNEEKFIIDNLNSLFLQDFQDFQCIVVNDGSTDQTHEKIKTFIIKNDLKNQFKVLNLEKSKHEPGAKVVNAFNKGLELYNLNDFDVVCKFDADIIFPINYLSKVNEIFANNPKSGMVSGLVYIEDNSKLQENIFDFNNENESWKFENISSKNHVRGPIKSYRKECFIEMKGLRSVLGWDNIDVMLAKMHHWETVTIKNIWVKHLKPTAYAYQNDKAKKMGIYFYNIGLNLPLAVISAAKASVKDQSFKNFWIILNSFIKQKHPRNLSNDELKFIRNLRWKEMKKKFNFN